jgi:hypothetical protein
MVATSTLAVCQNIFRCGDSNDVGDNLSTKIAAVSLGDKQREPGHWQCLYAQETVRALVGNWSGWGSRNPSVKADRFWKRCSCQSPDSDLDM